MEPETSSGLRRGVLVAAAAETLYWLYLVIGGLNDALPFAKGYGEVAAVLGTLVFVPFVLPALVLGLIGRALGLAVALTAIGGLLYGMDPLYRLTAMMDEVPVAALFALGLTVVVVSVFVGRRKRKT